MSSKLDQLAMHPTMTRYLGRDADTDTAERRAERTGVFDSVPDL